MHLNNYCYTVSCVCKELCTGKAIQAQLLFQAIRTNKMNYLSRIYDQLLKDTLSSVDAVLVEGPKWCGKTTTSLQQAKSVLYMQEPETKSQNLRLAELNPSTLLDGDTPRLIDEWQLAPQLWDAVRHQCDMRQKFGQFILTGSTKPFNEGGRTHSGTGRIARLCMRPMSLYESGESDGGVSIRHLFKDSYQQTFTAKAKKSCTLDDIAFLVARGGWPRAVGIKRNAALAQASNYYDALIHADLPQATGRVRDTRRLQAVLRSYARLTAGQGRSTTILADLAKAHEDLSLTTLREYIRALEHLFVIEDLDGWAPNLRSKAAIRTTPTRFFVDPSLAVAALGANPDGLCSDLNTLGLLFENLVIRDLRVYMDACKGFVSHYRDSNNLECDAVLHMRDGSYGFAEIKLGGSTLIKEGARALNKLEATIDTKSMGKPAFKIVITGVGEFAYHREDGIFIVPITVLGP